MLTISDGTKICKFFIYFFTFQSWIFLNENKKSLSKKNTLLIICRYLQIFSMPNHYLSFVAGSFKSQLIDYFRGRIVSWEKVEGSLWQFYDH